MDNSHMIDALRRICFARDYNADNGEYPADTLGKDQQFDDWAADVAEKALIAAGVKEKPKPKEEPKYKTIPVEIYGISNKDIPEETRIRNAERINKAIELMDAASRAIVGEIVHLIKIVGPQELTDAFAHLNCSSAIDMLIFWARKHEAAGAELHGACCNRPTHESIQKILDEQLE